MTNPITVVARILSKPDQEKALLAELFKLLVESRKDPGCVQYDLHQDNENPLQFLFFEVWESKNLWMAHMETAHLAAFKQVATSLMADLQVNLLTKLA